MNEEQKTYLLNCFSKFLQLICSLPFQLLGKLTRLKQGLVGGHKMRPHLQNVVRDQVFGSPKTGRNDEIIPVIS